MRKSILCNTVVSTALLVLAGCATTEQSLRARGLSSLTQSELEALFSRTRTVRRTTAAGAPIMNTYMQNGTSQIESPLGSYEGTWRINAGKFYTRSSARDQRVERCVTIYKTGDNEYQSFQEDGTFTSTMAFTN